MKRWNGWGNVNTDYPSLGFCASLSSNMIRLPVLLGRTRLTMTVLKSVPDIPSPSPTAGEHLCRNSLIPRPRPIPTRLGGTTFREDPGAFPDGVAYPQTEEDVRELLITYAKKAGAKVIPYGGGTSVNGHINPSKI